MRGRRNLGRAEVDEPVAEEREIIYYCSVMVDEKEVEIRKRGGIKQIVLFVVIAVIVLVVAGVGVYFYQQYNHTQKLLKNPTLAAQDEQKTLIEKVGKLIELPTGEEPTIATVSDVAKLQGQAFFAKAKNGDKVLIYSKAKKAVLYDPNANKIIEVGPINLGNQSRSQQASSSSAPSGTQAMVKVAIYNGTKIAGLAGITEKDLKAKMSNVTVVSKGNANGEYKKTIVIDLTGKEKTAAEQIAKSLNGEVSNLPAGESKPDSATTDLLVIVGKE